MTGNSAVDFGIIAHGGILSGAINAGINLAQGSIPGKIILRGSDLAFGYSASVVGQAGLEPATRPL